ncbi:MAG: DNA polymerase IV [Bacteroidetes bacterium]|nr:DNA polymerase IV [Bacteroidota bacterium]
MISSQFFIPREGEKHAENFRRVRILPQYSFPHIKEFDLNLRDNSRKVFYHLDLDAFFAQVEQRDNPELKGKPVSVGGWEDSNAGIVMTSSYEARKRGVKTGMSVIDAKKVCPELISLPCNGPKYERTLLDVITILKEHFPPDCVEQYSIDECFMDGSDIVRNFQEGEKLGRLVKEEIRKRLGLFISLGVSFNKSYAKAASKLDKPDGFTPIEFNKTERILNLSAEKLWGIGRRIYRRLLAMGIATIGELAQSNEVRMRKEFGINGIVFRKCARGEDTSGIFVKTEKEKCLGHNHTVLNPVTNSKDAEREIRYLAEYICRKMRSKKLVASNIHFSIRYDDLRYTGGEYRFPAFTNRDNEVYEAAKWIFYTLPQPSDYYRIRTFGIFVSDLHSDTFERNLDLFKKDVKFPYYELDKLKSRYGEKIIRIGINT